MLKIANFWLVVQYPEVFVFSNYHFLDALDEFKDGVTLAIL